MIENQETRSQRKNKDNALRILKSNLYELELTKKEYELLVYFISNQNRVITKQSIAEHLWGDHADFYDSFDFVYQHIKNLRKKIAAVDPDMEIIQSVYGVGYKYEL